MDVENLAVFTQPPFLACVALTALACFVLDDYRVQRRLAKLHGFAINRTWLLLVIAMMPVWPMVAGALPDDRPGTVPPWAFAAIHAGLASLFIYVSVLRLLDRAGEPHEDSL